MASGIKVIKSIFNKMAVMLLAVLIIGGLPTLVLMNQMSSNETVKGWLDDSNFYENLLDNVVELVSFDEEENGPTVAEELRSSGILEPEEFTTRFKAIFPPDYVQTNLESVIDAYYVWAYDSQPLSFSVDISDREQVFEDEISELMTTFYNGLPICTLDQLQFNPEDLFSAECRPPGLVVDSQVNQLVDELSSATDLFGEVFSQDSLEMTPEEIEDVSVFLENIAEDANDGENGESVPNPGIILSATKVFPVVYYVLVLLVVSFIILTGKSFRRGTRTAGFTLAIAGLLNLIVWRVLLSNVDNSTADFAKNEEFTEAQQTAYNNVFEPLAKQVIISIRDNVSTLALSITVIGLIMNGWYYFLAKRHHEKHHNDKTHDALKDHNSKGRKTDQEHKNSTKRSN